MIIPIGVDCGMAVFLRDENLRYASFPFDWVVSYNGVSECINDNFNSFTEPLNSRINNYDVYFHHDFNNDDKHEHDKEKYTRRCKRVIDILENNVDEEVIFCRKGHACHHHDEHDGKYCEILSDVDDAENLHVVLKNKYPNLKYKIIVILVCGKCFNADEIYKSSTDKIEIYNIATPQADDEKFLNCARSIFKL
jgi:hypothetical protein